MALSSDFVRDVFSNLASGKSENFFQHVADNVQWRVMGTHPLAGIYHNKEDFLQHTFHRLDKVLKQGVILEIKKIYICDDTAIVEMESLSTAINGKPFDNTYCWVTRFENNQIVEVRAYLDSELVQELIRDNEK
jgi:ketosteroid isomerase-like protein